MQLILDYVLFFAEHEPIIYEHADVGIHLKKNSPWFKPENIRSADQAFIEKAEKLKIGIEFRGGEDLKKDLQKDMKDFSGLVKELKLKPN